MDTWSTGEVARHLNVSLPTVRRAADRSGIHATATDGGHRRFRAEEVDAITRLTGTTPTVDGLTPSEVKALAALARHPHGLRSNRALARAAGLSPTAAGSAGARLRDLGLASLTDETVAEGTARTVAVWRLVVGPAWFVRAEQVSGTVPPARPAEPAPDRVPRRFWHQFWNVDPARLRIATDSEFIARRLVLGDDPGGRAWAFRHLDRNAVDAVRAARGIEPATRAMIDNVLQARP